MFLAFTTLPLYSLKTVQLALFKVFHFCIYHTSLELPKALFEINMKSQGNNDDVFSCISFDNDLFI